MPFEKVDHVQFNNGPQLRTSCELRFSALLGLDVNPPESFQSNIEEEFPTVKINIIPEEVFFPENQQSIQTQPMKNYSFSSNNNDWRINFTRNFLNISCEKHSNWNTFLRKVSFIIDAFFKNYKPKWFTRIGLRYINIIEKRQWGIKDNEPWNELINPQLLGLMGDGDISDCVEGINTITTLKCPNENIHMRIQAGVYTSIEQQADSFILDIDTFVMEKINANLMTAKEQLNILHEKPWNFFRYSITDKLYNLMEPVK